MYQIRLKSDLSAYSLNTAAKPNFIPTQMWALDDESVGFLSVSGQCGAYGATFADISRGTNPTPPLARFVTSLIRDVQLL
ncbi:hypothetical protein J4G07_21255 [Candidatus Poribacteria bacterium]|nr:hypothetical protein [Candidatus Poribacteria bacterium]